MIFKKWRRFWSRKNTFDHEKCHIFEKISNFNGAVFDFGAFLRHMVLKLCPKWYIGEKNYYDDLLNAKLRKGAVFESEIGLFLRFLEKSAHFKFPKRRLFFLSRISAIPENLGYRFRSRSSNFFFWAKSFKLAKIAPFLGTSENAPKVLFWRVARRL